MPRATFQGITFDLLVNGLQDDFQGMTTVRPIPGSAAPGAGPAAYVDIGGPTLQRRTVNLKLDNEAQFYFLATIPGTATSRGTLIGDGFEEEVVLLSVTRYYRRGPALFQLARSEWLILPPLSTVTVAGAPVGALPGPKPGAMAP